MAAACGGGLFMLETENLGLAQKFFEAQKLLGMRPEASAKCSRPQRGRQYFVAAGDKDRADELEAQFPVDSLGKKGKKGLSDCCKRAYLRGAFLAAGSVSNPEKNYHLEFAAFCKSHGEGLARLMGGYGLNAKLMERKGRYIVYLKEGENIVDLLNLMGAHKSLMRMENNRIVRDIRNNINRAVNCEAANIQKTISAALKQIDDIKTIERIAGLDCLSGQLEEVARLRLMHEEASLKEIGGMLTPAVGKSGVSHRLRKISEIAENLRGGLL
jgi:DNA-binding protein WhiA